MNRKHDSLQVNVIPLQKKCPVFSFIFIQFVVAAVKKGIPSNDELEHLSLEIAQWEKLGRRLNFKNSELKAFHKENEECSEKAFAMLLKWKEKNGSSATYRCLRKALCHEFVNRKDLAEKVCRG